MSNSSKNQSFDKQRRIYLSVLVVILVVALGVTVFSVTRHNDLADRSDEPNSSQPQQQYAENSSDATDHNNSVLDPDAKDVQQNMEQSNEQIDKEYSGSQSGDTAEASEENSLSEEQLHSDLDAPPRDTAEGDPPVSEPQIADFDPEVDRMLWPVSGNVLMDYSPDNLIYDATLDQYRTNDSISIAGTESEDVFAAAGGIVVEVGYLDEIGNYVVLDHGNGFETTYGQVDEKIPVTKDQKIVKGQKIGSIGSPSWYSVAIGTHVDFQVTVNGEPVNPMDYLENTLED